MQYNFINLFETDKNRRTCPPNSRTQLEFDSIELKPFPSRRADHTIINMDGDGNGDKTDEIGCGELQPTVLKVHGHDMKLKLVNFKLSTCPQR